MEEDDDEEFDEDDDEEDFEDEDMEPAATSQIALNTSRIAAASARRAQNVKHDNTPVFTETERLINPQRNKDLKKQAKLQRKKAARNAALSAFVGEGEELFDFGEHFDIPDGMDE